MKNKTFYMCIYDEGYEGFAVDFFTAKTLKNAWAKALKTYALRGFRGFKK